MEKKFIQNHISNTYFNLRVTIAILAFLLPVILILASLISSLFDLQSSISAFYHTPMRNVFVGILISAGISLYLYKGYSQRENISLNLAGILAIGVAIFPTRIPEKIQELAPPWLPAEPFIAPMIHGFCAIAFFIAIAFVCIRCGEETLDLIQDPVVKKNYVWTYRTLGLLMILLPITAAVILFISPAKTYLVFTVETITVWVFAAYWMTKSYELKKHTSQTDAEILLS